MSFSEYLSAWLQANNKSQAYIADLMGVSRQCVNNWARGRNMPSKEQMTRLRRILGVRFKLVVSV